MLPRPDAIGPGSRQESQHDKTQTCRDHRTSTDTVGPKGSPVQRTDMETIATGCGSSSVRIGSRSVTDESNYMFLCLAPKHWSAARTVEAAKRHMPRDVLRKGYVLFKLHPDWNIKGCNEATITTPKGHPPIEVERRLNGKKI